MNTKYDFLITAIKANKFQHPVPSFNLMVQQSKVY